MALGKGLMIKLMIQTNDPLEYDFAFFMVENPMG